MLSVVRRLPLSQFKRHTDRRGKSKVITRKGGGVFVADEMPLNPRIFRQNELRRDSPAASGAESCRRTSPRTRRFEIKK